MRWLALLVLAVAFSGCGGGGGGAPTSPGTPTLEGSVQGRVIKSAATATDYPLDIYLPPASAGPASALPVVYVLDGESWFNTLVGIVEAAHTRVIIVAINSAGQRNRDFVPPNNCTSGGGGNGAYFNFLRHELLPYVEGNIGGDPAKRILFGHSHGGAFVLYALFSEPAAQHTFRTYLPSDASISCMPGATSDWEATYAAATHELPVRLHLSYATQGNYAANRDYASLIAQRHYTQLVFVDQSYTGSHGGIVPQALADGVAFALAAP